MEMASLHQQLREAQKPTHPVESYPHAYVDCQMHDAASTLLKFSLQLNKSSRSCSTKFVRYFTSLAPPQYQAPPPPHAAISHCIPMLTTTWVSGMPLVSVRLLMDLLVDTLCSSCFPHH